MVAAKPCIKCSAVKPLDGFYPHPKMRDGHLNMCKECSKKAAREWTGANREKVSARNAERTKIPQQKALRAGHQRIAKKRNPEKFKARAAVARALKTGALVRQPCGVCGAPDTHGHHDDYSKRLQVRWLCFAHHLEAHGKIAMREWVIPAWRRR